MKRLALLAMTGFLAVILSACGENAEKKDNTTTGAAQTQGTETQTTEAPGTETTAPAAAPAAPEEPSQPAQ